MQILMTAFIVLLPQARWGDRIHADSHDSLYIVLLPQARWGDRIHADSHDSLYIVLLPQARCGDRIYADSHDSLYIVLLPVAALGASDASALVRAFRLLLLSLSSPLSFTFVN